MGDSAEIATHAVTRGLPPEMLTACYSEMRRMARRIMANNVLGQVLQPTELANEAAIRLIRANLENVKDRGHLLAVSARLMRQLMIDEARKGMAAKRHPPALMTAWPSDDEQVLVDIGDLDVALNALATLSPTRAEIVELRFMMGMTVQETSAAMGMPERTVKRQWQAARAWLLAHLNGKAVASAA